MDRREAIKNISIALGVSIATPTILGVLNSCSKQNDTWKPQFLSKTQVYMIDFLVDIILPKSDVLGGLEVHVTQFIDTMIYKGLNEKEQLVFNLGSETFVNAFKTKFNKQPLDGNKEAFNTLLDDYFKISKTEEESVFSLLELSISKVPQSKKETYQVYKFLTFIRQYSLLGFYTSEPILELDLESNPNVAYYLGCIDL